MGRVGLTAFLEASAEEVRLAHTQRWFIAAVGLSLLTLLLVMLVAVAVSWDTPHRVDTIVVLALLAGIGCAGAWYAYRLYTRPRVIHHQESVGTPAPPQALEAPAPAPVLQREHAWLLLPAAVLALMYPRITLRVVAGVLALWRGAATGAAMGPPPPH